MKKLILGSLAFLFFIACQTKQPMHNAHKQTHSAHESKINYRSPASEDLQRNQEIFSRYCKGVADSTELPSPNYDNPLIQKVTKLFEHIEPNSFYLYPAILRMYGLPKMPTLEDVKTPEQRIAASKITANNFFVYLCGEFRDRATMIEAKLQWFEKFNRLPQADQKEIDPSQDVWMQMTGKAYAPYIKFTRELWYARKAIMEADKKMTINIGKHEGVDLPVEGVTVCETKYIFNNYIAKQKNFAEKKQKKESPPPLNNYDDFAEDEVGSSASEIATVRSALNQYNLGYAKFKSGKTKNVQNCTVADTEDYYDFRGDSNYKPNSPESNGMIWYTLMIAQACKDRNTARAPKLVEGKAVHNQVTNETCQNYFRRPFHTRYEAARAGLSAWMLRKEQYDQQFADDQGTQLVIVPHFIKPSLVETGAEMDYFDTNKNPYQPFAFKFDQASPELIRDYLIDSQSFSSEFKSPHIGFKTALSQFDTTRQKELIYERLRDAVNRHTNWYASAWNDGLGTEKSTKDQAYSPFVASSYEPSESDNFTACGITVQCPPDGFKHWMFVFRIKGKNWYTTKDAAEGREINFDEMWFDETSLGTTGLAKREKAWDRLGTAMEEELTGGAILYLRNITSYGQVTKDGKMPANEEEYQEYELSPEAQKIATMYVEYKDSIGSYSQCTLYKDQGVYKRKVGHIEKVEGKPLGQEDAGYGYVSQVKALKAKELVDQIASMKVENLKTPAQIRFTRKAFFTVGGKKANIFTDKFNKFGMRTYIIHTPNQNIEFLNSTPKHVNTIKGKTESHKFIKKMERVCKVEAVG